MSHCRHNLCGTQHYITLIKLVLPDKQKITPGEMSLQDFYGFLNGGAKIETYTTKCLCRAEWEAERAGVPYVPNKGFPVYADFTGNKQQVLFPHRHGYSYADHIELALGIWQRYALRYPEHVPEVVELLSEEAETPEQIERIKSYWN